MKTAITIIIAGLAILLVAGSASAAYIKYVKGEEFAKVSTGNDSIYVSRVVDGDTTCYVTRHGEYGAHAISCVR